MIRGFNQALPHRVSFRETHHRQEVFVFLDDEGPKAALPQVALGLVDMMIMADVTGQQPLDPPAQVTLFLRLQDYMEMIRQEAVGENFDRMDLAGLDHQINEESIAFFLPENSVPTGPPVINVVDKRTSQSPADSGQTLFPPGKFPVSIFDERVGNNSP